MESINNSCVISEIASKINIKERKPTDIVIQIMNSEETKELKNKLFGEKNLYTDYGANPNEFEGAFNKMGSFFFWDINDYKYSVLLEQFERELYDIMEEKESYECEFMFNNDFED